jgi:hypothetical protein
MARPSIDTTSFYYPRGHHQKAKSIAPNQERHPKSIGVQFIEALTVVDVWDDFARPTDKHSSVTTFKVHEPLRHKGYNTLRRCLRVRQNPPAYAAWRGLYRFPVTEKQ